MTLRRFLSSILFLSSVSCGPKEDTACPDRQGMECPSDLIDWYVCDACGALWFCYHDGGSWTPWWNYRGYGYCHCIDERGGWDYEECPEEDK